MNEFVNPRTVYVIDDDPLVRASVCMQILSYGFEVSAYDSARSFLDNVSGLEPGCILLDLRMPDIDGISFLSSSRPQLAAFSVIVMTGHGDIQTAVRAMKLGAVDFIEKPFKPTVLNAMLEQAFETLSKRQDQSRARQDSAALIARLTPRELHVLSGLLAGHPNKVLAHQLGVSIRTIEMHRSNMMRRLGVRSLSDALKIAIGAGITIGE